MTSPNGIPSTMIPAETAPSTSVRTPWRRRLGQLAGLSAVSAVVMIAGCTGRVGDETVVETRSLESTTTTSTTSTSSPAQTPTTAAVSNGANTVERSTSAGNSSIGAEGLGDRATRTDDEADADTADLEADDEADAWTSTTLALEATAQAPTEQTAAEQTAAEQTTTSTTTSVPETTTSTAPESATTEAGDVTEENDDADLGDDTDTDDIEITAGATTTTTTTTAAPKPISSNWSGPATVAHVVVDTIGVYRQPGSQTGPSGADWTFASKTQFGSPMTFLVLSSAGDWHEVLLPIRQKHTRGWVHSSQIQTTTHNYHATVSVSTRRVVVYDNGVPIKDTGVVVGKESTPTPLGRFFVTDKLRHANPGSAYGPWILALSARSEALTTFNGGEPIVALHGTNKPWLVGGGHSNGCIRMPNDVITELAEFVPLGTPVDIVA